MRIKVVPSWVPFSKLFTFVFKLFNMGIIGTLMNIVMYNLSNSAFKAVKSFLANKSYVPMPVASSSSFLVA